MEREEGGRKGEEDEAGATRREMGFPQVTGAGASTPGYRRIPQGKRWGSVSVPWGFPPAR